MGEKEDLETYQVQLSQVELALTADPDNAELASLVSELKLLIDLTQQTLAHAQTTASSSKSSERKAVSAAPAVQWSAGDECLAKYSGDGAWYPARITSVAGSAERRMYVVVFKSYNTTEQVEVSALKPLPANSSSRWDAPAKRKINKEEEEERERKRKKNEKKLEVRAAKAKEQTQKQATWQKFTKKADKKGVHIAGVSGTSIFKTPDNPMGRVGVTGSGKGMTEYKEKSKHKFDPNAEMP
ncbi:hypothetical protein BV25DRAFT_1819132 [Artomyces pyxidatus]|uniref:Uncharacterized protein n=1 Tax=Artomyces pyxidatus TaxID=48021 RepID=A0ACB8TH28_9AGAM|nr:hypothetical protein BV25DRAFT_1819132 [Artomyces pyxidatus]